MMSINISIYGGMEVMGGNKIFVEVDNATICFDFGINYILWSQYFDREYLKPRVSRGLADLFQIGFLPPLRGIYRSDLEPSWDDIDPSLRSMIRDVQLDAVLLSHAHLDHSGHISLLDLNIPIVCSPATAFLAKAIQDSSEGDFEKEVCYAIPYEEQGQLAVARERQFYFPNAASLSPEAQAFWQEPIGARKMDSKQPKAVSHIGNLKLRSFPVDHSIYGATAFAIETSKGWIIYTGDLRFCGGMGYKTREFVNETAKLKPIVLLCDGTYIDKEGNAVTEEEVLHNGFQRVKKSAGKLVVVGFDRDNLERLLTFRQIAASHGRKLIILPKDAYLLQSLHLVMPEIPDPIADDILLVYEEAEKAVSWRSTLLARYRKQNRVVSPKDIKCEEGSYILCLKFEDITKLIDIKPSRGGIYIYSFSEVFNYSSEALNEEQHINIRRLRQWIDHFGLLAVGVPDAETGKVPQAERGFHSSGHASASELLEIINTINPKTVIPIHTQNSRLFADKVSLQRQVIIPKVGVPIKL